MNILFIYSSLTKGGIETFFVRISKKLKEKGNFKISFLFLSKYMDKELLDELSNYVQIYYLDDFMSCKMGYTKKSILFNLLLPIKKDFYSTVMQGVDHIHAPDFNSLLFANKILNKNKKIPISTGIYHINEFNFSVNSDCFFSKRINLFLKDLPYQNIVFFNEISKDFYSEKFQGKFKYSIVTPVGVDLDNDSSICGYQNKKIVSIGRLTSWKTYNYHMIDVVNNLKTKGIIISYDSYGDGPEKFALEEKVKELGLEDSVKFKDGVPYNEFKNIISKHLMFIGAGTALIEASSFGIPSLIGIENSKESVSFGFLHDTTGYSYQENEIKMVKSSIQSYIEKLIALDQNEYLQECQKAKIRANDFSIDKTVKDFNKLIINSKTQSFYLNMIDIYKIVFSLLINKLTKPSTNYSKRL